MKVQVDVTFGDRQINQILEGKDAKGIVKAARNAVAKELGWLKGGAVKLMKEVDFANEVIKRYEDAEKIVPRTKPVASCDAFIAWASRMKLAVIIPEETEVEE